MNKKLLPLSALALLLSFSACNNDDDDDNDDTALYGTLHAEIDGTDWDAQPENVIMVVADYGSGPDIYITASNTTDSAHFSFLFPYFNTTDTVITEPSDQTDLRFQSTSVVNGGIWREDTGTLTISRSMQDGIETYTGTFSGTFSDPFNSSDVKQITGGTFTAKRLL
jgi:hypothetical protein